MGARGMTFIATGLALVIVASTTSVGATVSPDDSARGKAWFAVGSAYGNASASQDGGTVNWDGAIFGGFRFRVDDAGLAEGEWIMTGAGTQEVKAGGVEISVELDYEGGGAVGGDETVLVASGSATTTGFEPRSGLSIDNTNELPPLGIEVDVFCNEMWGTWEVTVADAFQDEGFDTTMDGTFVGYAGLTGFSDEALEELGEHGFSEDFLLAWSGDYALADRVEFELVTIEANIAAISPAMDRLLATYPNWSGPDAYAVVDQIHVLFNVLDNLSGCARAAIGADEVESWIDSLHGTLRRLIASLVDLNLFPGAPPRAQSLVAPAAAPADTEPDPGQATLAYLQLVDFATRSAVIGAGALDPADAAAAEAALVDQGSRLLEGLEAVGGTDDDRRRVLLAGATMGWEFTVADQTVDPVGALAELGLGS